MKGIIAYCVAICFCFVFCVGAVWSIPVLDFNGAHVTEILGLQIGPDTFDVDFFFGNFNQVFGGTPDFSTQAEANAAGLAVSAALNASGAPAPFLFLDDGGAGSSGGPAAQFLIPHTVSPQSEVFNHAGLWGYNSNFLDSPTVTRKYAKFTASQSAVIPEPTTLVMFAVGFLGILGLGYRQQRRKKTAF